MLLRFSDLYFRLENCPGGNVEIAVLYLWVPHILDAFFQPRLENTTVQRLSDNFGKKFRKRITFVASLD